MNHVLATKSELYKAFIFECLVARLNHSSLEQAVKLCQDPDFDWDACLQAADEELVSPLLYDILRGRHIAPQAVEAVLLRKDDYNARRNLFLLHHMHQSQLLWRNDLAELILREKEKIRWDLLIDKAQTFQLILPCEVFCCR